MGRSLLAAAALGLTVGLAGCSSAAAPAGSAAPSARPAGSPTLSAPADPSDPSGSPASPSSASTADPSAGASPSLATRPAAECLTGTWQLVRFVAASSDTYGTGQGGDVGVRFAGDGYTLAGAGREPMKVTLAGQTADLTVDGSAKGTYVLDGSRATFTDGSTSGSAKVDVDGQSQRLTMEQVSNVIGLKGQGDVACTAQAMTITLAAVRLELART